MHSKQVLLLWTLYEFISPFASTVFDMRKTQEVGGWITSVVVWGGVLVSFSPSFLFFWRGWGDFLLTMEITSQISKKQSTGRRDICLISYKLGICSWARKFGKVSFYGAKGPYTSFPRLISSWYPGRKKSKWLFWWLFPFFWKSRIAFGIKFLLAHGALLWHCNCLCWIE